MITVNKAETLAAKKILELKTEEFFKKNSDRISMSRGVDGDKVIVNINIGKIGTKNPEDGITVDETRKWDESITIIVDRRTEEIDVL